MILKNFKAYWLVWIATSALVAFVIATQVVQFLPYRILSFLNSSFSTSFFGAVAGALTIVFIEWVRKQRQKLADINTSIAVFGSLLNALLNLKKQIVLPLINQYQAHLNEFRVIETIRKYSGNDKGVVPLSMNVQLVYCPDLSMEIPTDRIFTMTDTIPSIVQLLTQTKRSLTEVKNIFSEWNLLVEKFKNLNDAEKFSQYYGISSSGPTDLTFHNTIFEIPRIVDDALFFSNNSINALTVLGKKTLPFWHKKKIAKFNITKKDYKNLLPPDDYKEGWDLD